MTDWRKIEEEYISSDIAMRPLAARWGVPFQTLGGRAARGGWTRRREEYRRKKNEDEEITAGAEALGGPDGDGTTSSDLAALGHLPPGEGRGREDGLPRRCAPRNDGGNGAEAQGRNPSSVTATPCHLPPGEGRGREDGLPRPLAGPRNDAGEEGEGAEESEMMSEAVSLSLGWIVRRLRSGEVDDWHEIDGLLRALKGARDVGTARLRLDEREQRLKIAALEKASDRGAAPEPIEVRFVSLEGAER